MDLNRRANTHSHRNKTADATRRQLRPRTKPKESPIGEISFSRNSSQDFVVAATSTNGVGVCRAACRHFELPLGGRKNSVILVCPYVREDIRSRSCLSRPSSRVFPSFRGFHSLPGVTSFRRASQLHPRRRQRQHTREPSRQRLCVCALCCTYNSQCSDTVSRSKDSDLSKSSQVKSSRVKSSNNINAPQQRRHSFVCC